MPRASEVSAASNDGAPNTSRVISKSRSSSATEPAPLESAPIEYMT